MHRIDGTTLIEADDDGGLGPGGDLTKETDASSLIAGRRLGAGRYFIRVRSSDPQRLVVPYRLVVMLAASYAPEVEFNGTPGTAQVLPFDGGIVGLVSSADDVDYYEKLAANGATSLCVVVNGDHLQTGTSTDLVLSIRDVNDNLLLTVNSAFDPGGRKGQAACFPTTLSTYRFRVESNLGSTDRGHVLRS